MNLQTLIDRRRENGHAEQRISEMMRAEERQRVYAAIEAAESARARRAMLADREPAE